MIQLMGKTRNLRNVIAQSIKDADNSYFFENYTKQAQAVMAALNKAGYQIIPKSLPDELAREVAKSLPTGRMKPEQHVQRVVETAFKFLKDAPPGK